MEERLGVVRLLDRIFGSSENSKGYLELNPKVGCIYGDAIFYPRAQEILSRLQGLGYASNNVVFGSGGLLLNNWSRDTLKMAIKATYCEVNGKPRPIEKRPATDLGKRSKRGLLQLRREITDDGLLFTTVENAPTVEGGWLRRYYSNGQTQFPTLKDIRSEISAHSELTFV